MTTRSWVAVYGSDSNMLMLGGAKESRSSRFGTKEEAEQRLANALEINRKAGIECSGKVEPDSAPPEIFAHCGNISQSISGKCFGCGKVLTKQDAIEYSEPKTKQVTIAVWIVANVPADTETSVLTVDIKDIKVLDMNSKPVGTVINYGTVDVDENDAD